MELVFDYLHWLGFRLAAGLGCCLGPSGPLVACLIFVSAFSLLARLMVSSHLLLLMMLHLSGWVEEIVSRSN